MKKGKRKLRKRLKKQYKRRLQGRNKHHLTAKVNKGKSIPSNLLLIDIEKHICWHKIFGLRNLRQVIELLERIERLKAKQK